MQARALDPFRTFLENASPWPGLYWAHAVTLGVGTENLERKHETCNVVIEDPKRNRMARFIDYLWYNVGNGV